MDIKAYFTLAHLWNTLIMSSSPNPCGKFEKKKVVALDADLYVL